MSEFLDRLIARSAGQGEVIRPRTPSLFEPYSLHAAPVPPTVFDNTEVEDPGLSTDAGAHPRREWSVQTNDRTSVITPPEAAQSPSREAIPVIRPSIEKGQSLAHSESSPSYSGSRDNTLVGVHRRRGPDRADAESPPALTHAADLQTRFPRAALQENSHYHQAEVAPSVTLPSLPAKENKVASAAKGNSSEILPDSAVNHRAEAKPSLSISPPPQRDTLSWQPIQVRVRAPADTAKPMEQARAAYSLEQRRQSAFRRPSGQEPTIQVTIGRVEVRAEQPSPLPPAKERSNLKPMSLDEYLRQRTGKGRE